MFWLCVQSLNAVEIESSVVINCLFLDMITVKMCFSQQLQQQCLPQFVLVQPGNPIATPLSPGQFIISQTPQAQQSKLLSVFDFHAKLRKEMYLIVMEAFY